MFLSMKVKGYKLPILDFSFIRKANRLLFQQEDLEGDLVASQRRRQISIYIDLEVKNVV